jgi:hypothetical protein
MTDSAARLVDSVLPDVPSRQWVLTLPFDLRLLAAMRADVLRHIVRIYVQTILRLTRQRLRLPRPPGGFVAATHRGGGSLNLAPHVHLLAADGLFVRRPCPPRACRGAGDVGFHRAPAPSPVDLHWVVQTVRGSTPVDLHWVVQTVRGSTELAEVRRVLRRLAKMGLLRDERSTGEGSNESSDPGALEACGTLALRGAELESCNEGAIAEPDDVPPSRRPSRWSVHDSGFNIHAGVRVPAGDHVGRERICK